MCLLERHDVIQRQFLCLAIDVFIIIMVPTEVAILHKSGYRRHADITALLDALE